MSVYSQYIVAFPFLIPHTTCDKGRLLIQSAEQTTPLKRRMESYQFRDDDRFAPRIHYLEAAGRNQLRIRFIMGYLL